MFSFSKCFEKMVFPKTSNMIFLVLAGKMIFLFPENTILFFRRKMKDHLSQKNTCKYDIFCKCSEKMVFRKTLHQNLIFLVLSGAMIFLSPKNMMLFLRWKIKDHLSQKDAWKYDIFCIFGKDGIFVSYIYDITLLSKKQR